MQTDLRSAIKALTEYQDQLRKYDEFCRALTATPPPADGVGASAGAYVELDERSAQKLSRLYNTVQGTSDRFLTHSADTLQRLRAPRRKLSGASAPAAGSPPPPPSAAAKTPPPHPQPPPLSSDLSSSAPKRPRGRPRKLSGSTNSLSPSSSGVWSGFDVPDSPAAAPSAAPAAAPGPAAALGPGPAPSPAAAAGPGLAGGPPLAPAAPNELALLLRAELPVSAAPLPLCGAVPFPASDIVPPNSLVVAHIAATDDVPQQWLLALVQRYGPQPLLYQIADADPDVPQPRRKRYTVSRDDIVPLPTSVPKSWTKTTYFAKNSMVRAMFPDTTVFYRARVITAPPHHPAQQYVLEFDEDEDDSGEQSRRVVAPRFVVSATGGSTA